MNGPTLFLTSLTQSAARKLMGAWHNKLSPALVVSPNTLAFFARLHSVRLKMSFFGFRKGAFFFSRLCMMVRGALLLAYRAFIPRG